MEELITTKPGRYSWTTAKGMPGFGKMEIGAITGKATRHFDGLDYIYAMTLEDGKTVYPEKA